MYQLIKSVLLLTVSVALFSISSFAQKTQNHWAFGYKGLISFNTGSPELVGKSVLISSEGTATISDDDGNLLFYTDGDKVYDKNNDLIANGSGLGSPYTNASQSSMIIKKPGSNNLYYIFTTAPIEAMEKSFFYNVLDMDANGGKGEVIEKKQTIIADNSTEKLAAVSHTNGIDVWVLTQKHGDGGEMVAVLLTKNGIKPPILSPANNIPGFVGVQGGMTIARNGIDVVVCYEQDSISDHYTFNRQTGEFTYQQTLFDKSDNFRPYMPAFSADGSKLYIGARYSLGLYQFDMEDADVPGSKFKLTPSDTIADLRFCAPLLAPDDKIYLAGFGGAFNTGPSSYAHWLSIIDKPEVKGDACMFKAKGFYVDTANGASSMSYSPVYIPAEQNFTMEIDSYTCVSVITKIRITNLNPTSTYSFNWEVQGNIVPNDSSVLDYQFTSTGTFTIYCEVCDDYTNQCTELDSTIIVIDIPDINIDDEIVCKEEEALVIINKLPNVSYSWIPMAEVADSNYLGAGKYFIKASNICGDVIDSFNITEVPDIKVAIDDITVCGDGNAVIDLQNYKGLGVQMYWPQFNDSSYYRVFNDQQTATYEVQSTFCNNTQSEYFTITWVSKDIYVPNAFSPNQKDPAENEVFKPIGSIQPNSYKLEVFSRWGEKLFETNDPTVGWDGNYLGKPAEQAAYMYLITARTCKNNLVYIKGTVNLIR